MSVAGTARFLDVSLATVYRYVGEQRQAKRTLDQRLIDDLEAGLFYLVKYGELPTSYSFNLSAVEAGGGHPEELAPGERLRIGWLREDGDPRPQRFPHPSRIAQEWGSFDAYRVAVVRAFRQRAARGDPYEPRSDYPAMWCLVARHPVPPEILTVDPDVLLDDMTDDALELWFPRRAST